MSDFVGNYSSWDEAIADASGYDTPRILERVTAGALKVKHGEAAYEMDSLTYDSLDYFHPFLAQMLFIASCKGNRLNLLDFGGSLGSTYYLYRRFFDRLDAFKWSIVEQPHFVFTGKQQFEEGPLRFHYSVEECVKAERPDAILFSGSLQYLEDPYALLKQIVDRKFEFILFDRTPLFPLEDRITLEHVPPAIYGCSYPAWFFNEDRFLGMFRDRYELIDRADSFEEWELEDGAVVRNQILLLRRKA